MIKLLHLADLHLGTENYGREDPATGLNSRLLDFTAALDRAVDYALEQGIDVVLFAGDAYRSRDPTPTHQREFARRIRRLVEADVPVFLLVGNHDTPSAFGRASTVDIFGVLGVRHVHIGDRVASHRIETRRGPLQVVALPWVTRSRILAREEYKNKTADEINNLIAEKIDRMVSNQADGLDTGVPAVLVGHISVMGATWGSERSVMLGQDVVVPRSAVALPAFDYVALGHAHKHQVLGNLPLTIYAGSIERVDFSEEKEEKGFVVVELEKGHTQYQFVPLPARRFLTIEVQADGDEPLDQVLRAIEKQAIQEAVVRLIIHTTPEKEALIHHNEVRRALRDAHHVAGITKQVKREHRTRLGGRLAEEMTPLEALKLYLETKETPPERIKVLLEHAKGIVQSGGVL